MPSALDTALAAVVGAAAGAAGVAALAAAAPVDALLAAVTGSVTEAGGDTLTGASGVLPEVERAGAGRSASFLGALSS